MSVQHGSRDLGGSQQISIPFLFPNRGDGRQDSKQDTWRLASTTNMLHASSKSPSHPALSVSTFIKVDQVQVHYMECNYKCSFSFSLKKEGLREKLLAAQRPLPSPRRDEIVQL